MYILLAWAWICSYYVFYNIFHSCSGYSQSYSKKFYGAEDKYVLYVRVVACDQIVCDMCGSQVCEALSCILLWRQEEAEDKEKNAFLFLRNIFWDPCIKKNCTFVHRIDSLLRVDPLEFLLKILGSVSTFRSLQNSVILFLCRADFVFCPVTYLIPLTVKCAVIIFREIYPNAVMYRVFLFLLGR
jgi:hypothetical protein